MRVLKIPLRCMPTTCLTIPIVLRTAQIAKSRLSFSQLFPVSLIIILKVSSRFSKITRRWPACWSRSLSLSALVVDSRSRAMCLFVKQIKIYINIYFNFNNFPLAPQSKEIPSDSNHDVWTDQHVQSRSHDSGATMHIVRGLKHGWLISSNMHCFCFIQNRLIFYTLYILSLQNVFSKLSLNFSDI